MSASRKALDLGAVRERLGQEKGPRFWRSLDELVGTDEFQELVEREFPEQAAEWQDGVNRRRFLQLMGASLAFGGLVSCTRQPLEKIVPYVQQPEEIIPGRPLFFATSFDLDGYAMGLLAESHMGRPTKIEGNPQHPASLGATDLYAQASILDLYDPDRAQTVQQLGRIRTWGAFAEEVAAVLEAQRALGGEGFRILTGAVTSPTTTRLLEQILGEMPRAQWHRWSPVGHGATYGGAEAAFGRPLSVRYDFREADVVVALDADFLTDGAGSVRYAREALAKRRVREGDASMSRLYALESSPTATGTLADHRLSVSAAEVGHCAVALAAAVGVPGVSGGSLDRTDVAATVAAIADDLRSNAGRSVVLPGRQAPPELHAVAYAINAQLGNFGRTVFATESVEPHPSMGTESLAELVEAMNGGAVDTLLVLGGNPVYDAPADLDFLSGFQNVGRRIHLSGALNETSEYSHWRLPEAHYLESWGDGRAFDGLVSLTQPLIEPLYDGKSASEILSMFTSDGEREGQELLQATWRPRLGTDGDFSKAWRQALHDGFVAGTEAPVVEVAAQDVSPAARQLSARAVPSGERLELQFRADPTLYDGRFNNNAWLQECPKPLTKLTWDNAAHVSPALAQRLGLKNADHVEISHGDRSVTVPVWVHPGQPEHSVTVSLGYGRAFTGRVGEGTGTDVYPLRTQASLWQADGVSLRRTGGQSALASTQLHQNIAPSPYQGTNLEGREAEKRHLVRVGTLEEFIQDPEFAHHVGHGIDPDLSLMPGFEYDGYAWGLSVDLSACTGCNACVVACQSENNVPVVGKEQVLLGREMHWIRIDRYYEGDFDQPHMHHQPVMCMHCEQAPCEVVCPVSATVHSDEGLNDMVYNRCVGTRYCSNNCPYKVRRFNFLKWSDTETPVLKMLRNPDVTVRTRGVMEKCSYCVQRINSVRIDARREGREIEDGEIVTACQQACPTETIVFGNINDEESRVARRKHQPTDYGVLAELGTRPRTTYLAKVRNPNTELEGEA